MRLRVPSLRAAFPAALLAGSALFAACGGSSRGSDIDTVLKYAPPDAYGVTWFDLAALLDEREGDDILNATSGISTVLAQYRAIDEDDIENLATVPIDDSIVVIVEGGFDRDDLEDDLESDGYEEKEIADESGWEGPEPFRAAVFLEDDLVIFAPDRRVARDVIEGSRGEEDTFDDDDDIRDALDELERPDTPIAVAYGTACVFDGCEGMAIAQSYEDGRVRYHITYRFGDDDEADDAERDIEDVLENENRTSDDIELDVDGSYVKATFLIDIEEVTGQLGPGG